LHEILGGGVHECSNLKKKLLVCIQGTPFRINPGMISPLEKDSVFHRKTGRGSTPPEYL